MFLLKYIFYITSIYVFLFKNITKINRIKLDRVIFFLVIQKPNQTACYFLFRLNDFLFHNRSKLNWEYLYQTCRIYGVEKYLLGAVAEPGVTRMV
jgi:hypothetical protein